MNTIIPWILGGLVFLLMIGIVLTIRFWRESKVSPYYFLRRQAEQKMQTYSLGTVGAAVLLIFFVSYALQPQDDTSLRMALVSSAKPNSTNSTVNSQPLETPQQAETIIESPEIVDVTGNDSGELSADLLDQGRISVLEADVDPLSDLASTSALDLDSVEDSDLETVFALPTEFDQLLPSVTLSDATLISDLAFSTEIDDAGAALTTRRLFDESLNTIYATFDYDFMSNGMVWSWVWKHNGDVIGGGNQEWVYGEDGPGYIYLSPETGFLTGEYTLEIWVNGELMTESNMFVTDNLATSQ